jgi:dTDP-4-dehydrorhamnose 3,5-epimerase
MTRAYILAFMGLTDMNIEHTAIDGIVILTPARHGDARGFFSESWNRARMADAGLDIDFVQDNHSMSASVGTVRGLHYQAPPYAQGKLVRCGRGALFDVAVDVRVGSPTYGHHVGAELSFENGHQMLVPAGFLHGFMTLTDDTEIVYKCTDFYNAQADGAVRWDSCGIDWPNATAAILSPKDEAAPVLADFVSPFQIDGTT